MNSIPESTSERRRRLAREAQARKRAELKRLGHRHLNLHVRNAAGAALDKLSEASGLNLSVAVGAALILAADPEGVLRDCPATEPPEILRWIIREGILPPDL